MAAVTQLGAVLAVANLSMGVLATTLWLIGRDSALASLATPKEDRGALELDVRQAEALGRDWVRATAQARANRVLELAAKRQGLANQT